MAQRKLTGVSISAITSMPRCNWQINIILDKVHRVTSHCCGVRNDIGYILRGVNGCGRICPLSRQLLEARYLERETLTVDDMPMERTNLCTTLILFGRSMIFEYMYTLTQLIASRVRLISATGKLSEGRMSSKVYILECNTHKFLAVSSMNPR